MGKGWLRYVADTTWAIKARHVSIQEQWRLSLNVFPGKLREEVLGFAIWTPVLKENENQAEEGMTNCATSLFKPKGC